MGSPIACVLANLYMEYFECELRTQLPQQPAIWWRYVDDIICIWPHDTNIFDNFLQGLNRLAPSIKFSAEWETLDVETGVATLPFLDVLIHRSPGGVTFSVYRKPSHCHMYIHYYSLHAPHVKRGVLSGLFLRALRISSNEHLQPELDLLWAAFRRLGYPNFFIREALSAAKTKFYSNPPISTPSATPTATPISKPHYVSLPYHPSFSKLKHHLQNSNHKLVFHYRETTMRMVVKKKGSTVNSTHEQAGVYSIPCKVSECDKTYYGMTSRPYQKRLGEHQNNIRDKVDSSALVQHLSSHPGHEFDFSAASLIWKTNSQIERQTVEAACIRALPNCNRGAPEIHVSPLLASVFMKATGINKPTRLDVRKPTPLYSPTSAPSSTHTQTTHPTPSLTTSHSYSRPRHTLSPSLLDSSLPSFFSPTTSLPSQPTSTPTSQPIPSTLPSLSSPITSTNLSSHTIPTHTSIHDFQSIPTTLTPTLSSIPTPQLTLTHANSQPLPQSQPSTPLRLPPHSSSQPPPAQSPLHPLLHLRRKYSLNSNGIPSPRRLRYGASKAVGYYKCPSIR